MDTPTENAPGPATTPRGWGDGAPTIQESYSAVVQAVKALSTRAETLAKSDSKVDREEARELLVSADKGLTVAFNLIRLVSDEMDLSRRVLAAKTDGG